MGKVKRPQDFGVVVPKTPVLEEDDDSEDFEDDLEFEEMSDAGQTLAAEDLSVLDFFAGLIAVGTVLAARTPGGQVQVPPDIGELSYKAAKRLIEERKRIRLEDSDDA